MLVPVPGGGDGPGGVLVCAENFIIYSNQVQWHILMQGCDGNRDVPDACQLADVLLSEGGSMTAARVIDWVIMQDHADVRAVIPRRNSLLVDRGVLIVSYAMHKQKSLFFFLLQVGGVCISCRLPPLEYTTARTFRSCAAAGLVLLLLLSNG